jgi:hypothetical protein
MTRHIAFAALFSLSALMGVSAPAKAESVFASMLADGTSWTLRTPQDRGASL